jgi:glycosyltransferase involved in cell wall biosynthesis
VLDNRRVYFHFLADAAQAAQNVRGAIDLAALAGTRLHVIGGKRFHFRRGLRITLSPHARFHGQLAGEGKAALLQGSRGLIHPVLSPEPFSLAVVESLYAGCPLFGTPYGALPELLGRKTPPDDQRRWKGTVDAFHSDLGCLCVSKSELVEALRDADHYSRRRCHEYAVEHYSADRMARAYEQLYQQAVEVKCC